MELESSDQTDHANVSPVFMDAASIVADVPLEYLLTETWKMMFVSGETGDPPPETTGIIEEIVREQVIGIVRSLSLSL
jgi:Transcription initiation factor IID, 18kD subunit